MQACARTSVRMCACTSTIVCMSASASIYERVGAHARGVGICVYMCMCVPASVCERVGVPGLCSPIAQLRGCANLSHVFCIRAQVGPGTGNLTKHLLARGAHVTSIEKDDVLFSRLSEEYAQVCVYVRVHMCVAVHATHVWSLCKVPHA